MKKNSDASHSGTKAEFPRKEKASLDPKLREYLQLIKDSNRPPLFELPAAEARAVYKEGRRIAIADPEPVAESSDFEISGTQGVFRVRRFRPEALIHDDQAPALVYLHGGGWTIGDIDTHDSLCRQLANDAPCVVISVDYHLAPEFPFPAAVTDGVEAVQWVVANAKSLKIDAERVAIGGDSAGANLATVICMIFRDQGGSSLVHQLLYYPATDQRMLSASHVENGSGYFLTKELIEYFRFQYLGRTNYEDWRASPILQPNLRGLPSAQVITAGYDPLRDEGFEYAEALKAAGVSVDYKCYEDQIHGFINIAKVSSRARIAIQRSAAILAGAFQSQPKSQHKSQTPSSQSSKSSHSGGTSS